MNQPTRSGPAAGPEAVPDAAAGPADPATRLRVLVVIDALAQGGAEHSLAATLPRLRPLGIDAEVLCRYRAESHIEAPLVAQGIPVTIAPSASPVPFGRWLRRRIDAVDPDLVHLNLFVPMVAGLLATVGTATPTLVSLVATPQTAQPNIAPWKLRVVNGVEAFAGHHLASAIHAVTPGVRDAAIETMGIPAGKILLGERGRDQERFRPATPNEAILARDRLEVASDAEVLVAVGRHEHVKGFAHLIASVATLQRRRPDLVLLIAGRPGGESAPLAEQVASLPRPEDVRLLGDRDDVEVILHAADLFVLSSLREGAAGGSIEAMACGLPIVATDLAGTRGILRDGHEAVLVPAGDPAALAAAIGRVLDDPALAAALGATGHRTFLDRFTIERAAEALAGVYRSAAARPPLSLRSLLRPGRHGHPAAHL